MITISNSLKGIPLVALEEYQLTPSVDVSIQLTVSGMCEYQFHQADPDGWSTLEYREHLLCPSGIVVFFRSSPRDAKLVRTDVE
jgi:hypothetical protein